jgi:hypothetical protein
MTLKDLNHQTHKMKLAEKLRNQVQIVKVKRELSKKQEKARAMKQLKTDIKWWQDKFKVLAAKAKDGCRFADLPIYASDFEIIDTVPSQWDCPFTSKVKSQAFQGFCNWLTSEGFKFHVNRHKDYDPDGSSYNYYMRIEW